MYRQISDDPAGQTAITQQEENQGRQMPQVNPQEARRGHRRGKLFPGRRHRGLRQKNIVAYVTRQYMKQNKRRTFSAWMGIVFMVLLLTCVFVGRDACIRYLEDLGTLKKGKWHACVYDITQEEAERLNTLPYLKQTAASADYGLACWDVTASEKTSYLHVKAYEPACFDWMNIRLLEGRLPETEGEIVLSSRVRDQGARIAVGDRVKASYIDRSITGINPRKDSISFPYYQMSVSYNETIKVPLDFPYYLNDPDIREEAVSTGKTGDYEVVGFVEPPYFENAAGYLGLTVLTAEAVAELSGFNLSMIFDTDQIPDNWREEIRQQVDPDREYDINDYVLIFTGHSDQATLNLITGVMMAFFTGLIVLASVFLIFNVFQMSYEERSRYLGMLSSVGATGRQKRGSVYYEVYHLLVFALPVGMLLGIGTIKLGITLLSPFLGVFMRLREYVDQLPVRVHVSLPMAGVVVLAAILTVGFSAFLPAMRLTKTGPVENIRGSQSAGKGVCRSGFGWLRYTGIEGMLARNTVVRQRKKTRSVMMSVTVFVMILAITGFGAVEVSSVVRMAVSEDADIQFHTDDWDYTFAPVGCSEKELEDLKQEIAADPGVEQIRVWNSGMFVGETTEEALSMEYKRAYDSVISQFFDGELPDWEDTGYNRSVSILAVDDQTLEHMAELTGSDMDILTDPEHPGAIVVQNGFLSTKDIRVHGREADFHAYEISRMTDLEKGALLPMEIYSAKKKKVLDYSFKIAGFASGSQLNEYVSFHGEFFWIITGWDNARKLQKAAGEGRRYRSMTPRIMIRMNGSPSDLKDRLEQMETIGYGFRDNKNADVSFGDALISVINIMLGCFVALTSVICLLNLANSIRGRLTSRRQEFAMLESMGISRAQKRKMLLYECAGILLRAFLAAAVCSAPVMYGIRRILVSLSGYYLVKASWLAGVCTAAAAAAISAVILLTLYESHREMAVDILEDIRRESV